MDRRRFLKTLGIGAGALATVPLLQACAPSAPASKPAEAPKTEAKPAAQPTPAAADSSQAQKAEAPKPAEAAKPAQAPAAAAGPVKRGGTLNIVVQNDWVTFDPPYNTAEPGGMNMIYGEWVRWEPDEKGQWAAKPDMLAEWDLKPDVITFKLQKGVKFHDGTPWDAKAAKWNLDRIIFDPASGARASWNVVDIAREDKPALEEGKARAATAFDYSSKAVEAIGDDTLKVNLAKPMAQAMSALGSPPVSPEAFAKHGKANYGRNPVGAGPYRFVEWKTGSHVILERNPEYWRKGADGQALPYIDRLHYRLIIDDSVRLLELKSGAAQFTELIQGKDIAGVKADPNLAIMESQASGNNYRMIFDSTNDESPLKKHKKLRQAVLYALDREAMARTLGFGSGFGRKYLLPKGSFGYDEAEQIPHYWYDKAKAEALVKEVLAEDRAVAGSDGKVKVTISVIDRAVDKQQSEMLKQMLDGVGFSTTLESLERAAWTAKLVKRPGQPGGKFEIATMRNPVTPEEPDAQWRTFFHSAGGFNVAHVEDKSWDEIIDQGATTYDQAQRRKTYLDIERKAFDEAWYGYLWQQNWNWTYAKKLQNFKERITNRWFFTDCWLS